MFSVRSKGTGAVMATSYTFMARVKRSEPIPGIVTVTLELIRDEDFVELDEGDEFVTVAMRVNPFRGDGDA